MLLSFVTGALYVVEGALLAAADLHTIPLSGIRAAPLLISPKPSPTDRPACSHFGRSLIKPQRKCDSLHRIANRHSLFTIRFHQFAFVTQIRGSCPWTLGEYGTSLALILGRTPCDNANYSCTSPGLGCSIETGNFSDAGGWVATFQCRSHSHSNVAIIWSSLSLAGDTCLRTFLQAAIQPTKPLHRGGAVAGRSSFCSCF